MEKRRFAGIVTANNVTITGFTTVTGDYDIQNSDGQITAGIVTTANLVVGTSLTVNWSFQPSILLQI